MTLQRRQFGFNALAVLGAALVPSGLPAFAKSGFEVLLAQNAPAKLNPAPYLISEKLDGVRAVWDGTSLRFRSGRPIVAPAWFIAGLPSTALDGELWIGRGKFDQVSAAVRKTQPVDAQWQQITYMVFELPQGEGVFADRAQRLKLIVQGLNLAHVQAVEQFRLPNQAVLQARLNSVTAAGGEGLMLHQSQALYTTGRSDALLKLKPVQDAEAQVVGYTPGRGKYDGMLGALQVKTEAGLRFNLGTGLSDELRKTPPPLGSTVTYSYRDITPSGKPRFASFLRVADEP